MEITLRCPSCSKEQQRKHLKFKLNGGNLIIDPPQYCQCGEEMEHIHPKGEYKAKMKKPTGDKSKKFWDRRKY